MQTFFRFPRHRLPRYHRRVPDQSYDPDASYLTVAEAAAMLKIKTQSLRTAIQTGRLPVVRVHGRVLITPEALEEYRQRTQPEGRPKQGRPPKG